MKTRILVLGTGALGSFFAAALARAGAGVTVAGSWEAALGSIARHGIAVEEGRETWRARVDVRRLGGGSTLGAARFDLVLVLVKAWATASIAELAARAAGADGMVVSLQNGLGPLESLTRAAPGRVAGGTTSAAATLLDPGRVRATARGATVVGGEVARGRLDALASLLADAGFPTATTDDLDGVRWTKLAVSCAINPVTALAGVPNGALLERPELERQAVAAAREVGEVARALGIRLAADPAARALEVARTTAANRSSMLQDLDRGRPTEIEAVCGAVVERGRATGVATPVLAALLAAVREREAVVERVASGGAR